MKDKGVTLIELIVVTIIIGILAAIGLPQFSKTKEKAFGKEAQGNLKLIAAAERIYQMEVAAYYPKPAGPQTPTLTPVEKIIEMNNSLKLSTPSGSNRNWNYTVDSSTTTATATRTSSGCTYTMRFTGEDATNVDCP